MLDEKQIYDEEGFFDLGWSYEQLIIMGFIGIVTLYLMFTINFIFAIIVGLFSIFLFLCYNGKRKIKFEGKRLITIKNTLFRKYKKWNFFPQIDEYDISFIRNNFIFKNYTIKLSLHKKGFKDSNFIGAFAKFFKGINSYENYGFTTIKQETALQIFNQVKLFCEELSK